MPAERTDIQGIVRSGYGTLSEALFVLLRISDAVAAKRWLAAAPVTSAAFEGKLTGALQVALTPRGLRALGLSDEAVALFSPEFTSGMAGDAGRSRRLGDEDVNDPRHWAWGGAADETGLLLMLYAEPGGLAAWRDMVETEHYRQGFEVLRELPTSDLGGHEPFGFADGISQPKLNWDAPIRRLGDDVAEYTNRMELGEVLLGYGNEYGLVTDRPLLEATADPTAILAAADGRADIACNGSTWCCASSSRTSQGSGASPMRMAARPSPRRWWAGRCPEHRCSPPAGRSTAWSKATAPTSSASAMTPTGSSARSARMCGGPTRAPATDRASATASAACCNCWASLMRGRRAIPWPPAASTASCAAATPMAAITAGQPPPRPGRAGSTSSASTPTSRGSSSSSRAPGCKARSSAG